MTVFMQNKVWLAQNRHFTVLHDTLCIGRWWVVGSAWTGRETSDTCKGQPTQTVSLVYQEHVNNESCFQACLKNWRKGLIGLGRRLMGY